MKIAIGNDHAGVEVKKNIEKLLSEKGYTVINKGYDGKESVDYPDYIHPVSIEVKEKKAQIGIIICGSGNGAAMTANKHKGVRAAICWSEEIAELARQHNDANIISIPSRFLSDEEIKNIVAELTILEIRFVCLSIDEATKHFSGKRTCWVSVCSG